MNWNFTGDDALTKELMKDPNLVALRAQLQQILAGGGDAAGLHGTHDFVDPGTGPQILKDMSGVFSGGAIGSNPADGFLGSYNLSYNLDPEKNGQAAVHITVTNTTNVASLTHLERLPGVGHDLIPLENLSDNATGLLSSTQGGVELRVPASMITQTFTWSEVITEPKIVVNL